MIFAYWRQILPVFSSNLRAFYLSCEALLLDAHYRIGSWDDDDDNA